MKNIINPSIFLNLTISIIIFFSLSACIPKSPKRLGYGTSNYSLDHTGLTACRDCHYTRSYPSSHRAIGTDECSKCHGTNSWDVHIGAISCSMCHEDNTNFTTNTNRPTSANYATTHDPSLTNIKHYERLKLTGELNGQVDCINCHVIGTWSFSHKRHNGSNLPLCLPCHQTQGASTHGVYSSYYQPYSYANGLYGSCANCHSSSFRD